mgnify:CR=1 FL=1
MAVPAEEIKKKKRKKEVDEEGFEVGRYLGVIARKDPELYERLKQYAEATGHKFTDMVYEALTLYDEYLQLSTVDARSLLVALRLLDHLFKRLLQMMMTLNQYFTTEFFQQQVDIIHQIQQQRAQQLANMKQEEKKAKMNEVKAKMIEMTMNLVSTLLGNLMTGMMGAMAKTQGMQQLPSKQVSMPSFGTEATKGVKVVRSAARTKQPSKREAS